MSAGPGDLDPDRVRAYLRTERYGRSLDVRGRTGSTNDDARAAAQAGAVDGHAVVADAQDAGRGARGRAWSSPAGTDLYLSVVARAPLPPDRIAGLTLAVGLGVVEAVDAALGRRDARLKWPNDVQLGGRKVAGILVEATSRGDRLDALVVGVGLNVNRRAFPAELREVATSLALHAGADLDRADVLAQALLGIENAVRGVVAAGGRPPVEAVTARLAYLDAEVDIDGTEGTLIGLAPSGAARLRGAAGQILEVTAGTLRPRA